MITTYPLYDTERREVAEILDASVLPAYADSLKPLNERARTTLGQFTNVDGELVGSSPLMLIHLANSGALPARVTLATRQQLEKAFQYDKTGEFLAGRYADFGLALRTAGDSHAPNNSIAERLGTQLQKKTGLGNGSGLLIPFSALVDSEDPDSYYGLTLNISQKLLDATPEDVREVIHDLGAYKWNYTRQDGVACAVVGSSWDWYSGDERLGSSNGGGRVVGIRAIGTTPKIFEQELSDYAAQVEQARDTYIEGLKKIRGQINRNLRSATRRK